MGQNELPGGCPNRIDSELGGMGHRRMMMLNFPRVKMVVRSQPLMDQNPFPKNRSFLGIDGQSCCFLDLNRSDRSTGPNPNNKQERIEVQQEMGREKWWLSLRRIRRPQGGVLRLWTGLMAKKNQVNAWYF
jgi:hypothetical protein